MYNFISTGAGSTFEGLRAGKSLMVVPNSALMDNHQIELAHHLEKLGYLVSCTDSCNELGSCNTYYIPDQSIPPMSSG